MVDGALGSYLWLGLYALLRDELHLHRSCGFGRLPCAMFNIGGEGQAMLGGLGVALGCLYIPWPHWSLALLGGLVAPGIFGACWAAIPAYSAGQTRQPHRDHHDHVQLYRGRFAELFLVNCCARKGRWIRRPLRFPELTCPRCMIVLAPIGIVSKAAPANVTFVAVLACFAVWVLIWRTQLGYEIRAYGHSEAARNMRVSRRRKSP